MGFDDEGADGRILFDLETAPLGEAARYLDPIEPPSNYRDPVKIEEYVRTKEREQLERAALDVDLCRIIAIGSLRPGDDVPSVQLAADDRDEREAIRLFFAVANGSRFIGFNILDFDLPVLLRRALYLGVEVPYVALDRYKHPRVIDLLQALSWNGKLKYRSQSFYAKRFAVEVEDDAYEGRDIPHLFETGQLDAVVQHVRCDVLQARAIARRLGYWPR